MHTCSPPYLADLLLFRNLHLLPVPRHKLNFGSQVFHVFAPSVWNTLPPSVRDFESLTGSHCR